MTSRTKYNLLTALWISFHLCLGNAWLILFLFGKRLHEQSFAWSEMTTTPVVAYFLCFNIPALLILTGCARYLCRRRGSWLEIIVLSAACSVGIQAAGVFVFWLQILFSANWHNLTELLETFHALGISAFVTSLAMAAMVWLYLPFFLVNLLYFRKARALAQR